MRDMDKIQACLMGGALGDSLGYAVEFYSLEEIKRLYGPEGIKNFRLFDKKSIISDDTQMSLFTANGLLLAHTNKNLRDEEVDYVDYVYEAYKDWHRGQVGLLMDDFESDYFLCNYSYLIEPRHPGRTIMTSLQNNPRGGDLENRINDSKGCGTIMRMAPVGLFFTEDDFEDLDKGIMEISRDISLLTHGHDLAFIPSAMFSLIINGLVRGEEDLDKLVDQALEKTLDFFSASEEISYFEDKIRLAISLAGEEEDDILAIEKLGQGWVAEETLAIALYVSLKYRDDFRKALQVSVNHDGDSDSTGAITGNILGAYLGMRKVFMGFDLSMLEGYDLIFELGKDLTMRYPLNENYDVKWVMKYLLANYGYGF